MIDPKLLKKDFPIFQSHPDLVYLDSSATSLKPRSVIEKEREYYEEYSANVFRGLYQISEKATEEYEESRSVVATFINAKNPDEVIFTRNASESLNLIAYSLGRKIMKSGDEIVTTIMEHHSNFVPWQQLALENGGIFKVIDINEEGALPLKALEQIISKKTKIFALTHISNVLGVINPVEKIATLAKKINPNIIIVVDAAQSIPHMKVDVQQLGCDFIAFSSHKMLGPTGVGVLWGKYAILDQMFPFQYGGEMIEEVYVNKTVFKKPPLKFEAGTPHIAGVIALKEAVNYLKKIGIENVRKHEKTLVSYAYRRLKETFSDGIHITGPRIAQERGGILAFTFKNYHPHDIAQILDEEHIAVRAGHHCAMPLHQRLKLNATTRASLYVYNTKEDVDKLVDGLKKIERMLK
ncbi:SufS family cysteine desulfurase [Candidatus Roizmanbacteria bacterium]|nr:SufS family cysteine desulfurase [Candidatus Roizmanbacteria bacterium]